MRWFLLAGVLVLVSSRPVASGVGGARNSAVIVDRMAAIQAEAVRSPQREPAGVSWPALPAEEGESITVDGWELIRIAPSGADDPDLMRVVRSEWKDAISDYFRDEALEARFWELRDREFGAMEAVFERALDSFVPIYGRNIALALKGANQERAKRVREGYDSALKQWLGSEEYARFDVFRDEFRDHCIARWGRNFGFAW